MELSQRELVRSLRTQQVRPAGGAYEQTSSGKQSDRCTVDKHQVADVLRCVSGRMDRPYHQSIVGQILQVECWRVVEGDAGARRHHQLRVRTPGELAPARDIVMWTCVSSTNRMRVPSA